MTERMELHDPKLESQVVVSLAYERTLWPRAEHLRAEHFFDSRARDAFQRMRQMANQGRLWAPEDWDVGLLATTTPDFVMFDEHVRRLEEQLVVREGFLLGQRLATAAGKRDLAELYRLVSTASLPANTSTYTSGAHAAGELWELVGSGDSLVLPTGFGALDAIRLLAKGEVTVLAARTSMGKSQLAFQVAYNVAKLGGVVLVASLEMSRRQVVARMAQALTGYAYWDARAEAQDATAKTLTDFMAGMSNLLIVDEPMSSEELLYQARIVAGKHGLLALVVSDHLRCFSDRSSEERHRLGQIVRNQRRLAHEHNCPVLTAAQLNRSADGRDDKRPGLSDLRDSGEIEEDADKVAFLYREAYYGKQGDTDKSGVAELYMAKNRNGPLGGARLYFDAKKGPRFTDLARPDAPPAPREADR